MQIYIAYKFSGQDKKKLKETLTDISNILGNKNYKSFIFFRDVENWGEIPMTSSQVITQAFQQLKKADILFALVADSEKSEGLLLEVGFAKALGKKIVLAIKDDVRAVFLKDVADLIISFNNLEDLQVKLKEKFNAKDVMVD